MSELYHKINAPFTRDKKGVIQEGQWCLPELEYLAGNKWQWTEKVDGTNIRLTFIQSTATDAPPMVLVGGRTDNAQIPPALLQELKSLASDTAADVDEVMRERGITELTIYGEGYGPRINGGGKYGEFPQFVAFDIKVGDFWLRRHDVIEFCEATGFDSVPVVGEGTLYEAIVRVREGLQSQWGDFEAEGIIAVPKVPLFARNGSRIITKIKARDFRP